MIFMRKTSVAPRRESSVTTNTNIHTFSPVKKQIGGGRARARAVRYIFLVLLMPCECAQSFKSAKKINWIERQPAFRMSGFTKIIRSSADAKIKTGSAQFNLMKKEPSSHPVRM